MKNGACFWCKKIHTGRCSSMPTRYNPPPQKDDDMKERELTKHMKCDACQRELTETSLPLFWTLTVTRYGLDANAIRRRMGLGMAMGSGALASIMGPDEDLAVKVMEPVEITLCETCAIQDPKIPACHVAMMKAEESDDESAET